MRTFLAVLLALPLLYGCKTANTLTSTPSFSREGVYKVRYHRPRSSQSSVGSGFFIGKRGCFITTYHQYVSTVGWLMRVEYDKGINNLEFIGGIIDWDVAFFRTDTIPLPNPVALRKDFYLPQEGEELFLVGSPQIIKRLVADKEVMGIFKVVKPDIPVLKDQLFLGYQLAGSRLVPGDSGSALMTSTGEVVGIINGTALKAKKKNLGYAIPLSETLLGPFFKILNC